MSVTYDNIVSAQQEQGDVIRKTSLTFQIHLLSLQDQQFT